jgi:hypothetical protein
MTVSSVRVKVIYLGLGRKSILKTKRFCTKICSISKTTQSGEFPTWKVKKNLNFFIFIIMGSLQINKGRPYVKTTSVCPSVPL